MQAYNSKGRYAAGDIMTFKGRPWRARVSHDESDSALLPDANFACWEMLPLTTDKGKSFGYCEPCNGRSVNPAGECELCGAGKTEVARRGVMARLFGSIRGGASR